MDPQRPVYLQRVRKKSVGLINAMAAKKANNPPRDHQKLIRSVRFTPRGFEKRALG